MQITHLGHACLLVEVGGRRLLIDPGAFSTDWHDQRDLDAIVVTHQHPDHVDPEHVPALLAANPAAKLLVEPTVIDVLDLPEGTGERMVEGHDIDLDGVRLTPVGGRHAVIHEDIPRVGNLGVLVRAEGEPTLLHPGDTYEYTPAGVDILAVPVNAPWCAFKETVEFTRAVRPAQLLPIHDALLSPTGRALYLRQLAAHGKAPINDLKGAGRVEIT